MSSFRQLKLFCILLLQPFSNVCSQWCGGCNSGPIYYVPASAPPEYKNIVQRYPIDYSCQPGVPIGPPPGIPPPGVPPPLGVPFPPGSPPLYEGQYQAAAAAAAHPNQPVIIINNGDYGSKKEGGGLFGGDGGDILALLLATHAHHGGHGHPADYGPPEPLPPPPPPSFYDRGCDDGDNNRCGYGPININITIVLPKSESSKNEKEDE